MPGRHDPNSYRTDCRMLVPTACRLYKEGKSRSEVLEAIYGIDLPPEALLFLRDYVGDAKPLDALWLNHPWQLMIPHEEGGARLEVGPLSLQLESWAFAEAPHVLLLGISGYNHVQYGDSLFGYDLDELRAGRTTIVGLESYQKVPESGAEFTVFGPSLLGFFHDLISRYHGLMDKWRKTNVCVLSYADLEEYAEQLRDIEALQRELAGTAGWP